MQSSKANNTSVDHYKGVGYPTPTNSEIMTMPDYKQLDLLLDEIPTEKRDQWLERMVSRCPGCKKAFLRTFVHQVHCCEDCRQQHYRDKAAEIRRLGKEALKKK